MLKPIVKSNGIVKADVVKVNKPISLLGDFDPEAGKVGELNVANKILALPYVRGSTVGPYALWHASKIGKAPIAIVAERVDLMLITAAVLASIPLFEGSLNPKCVILNLSTGEYRDC